MNRTFAIVTALSLGLATSGYAFASTGTSGSVDTGSKQSFITVASKDHHKDHGSKDKNSNDNGSTDNVSNDG